MNLPDTFIKQAQARGLTPTEAVGILNAELGTSYTLSRLGEWRNGRRALPARVHRYMMEQVLGEAIKDHGGRPPKTADATIALAAALLPAQRTTANTTKEDT